MTRKPNGPSIRYRNFRPRRRTHRSGAPAGIAAFGLLVGVAGGVLLTESGPHAAFAAETGGVLSGRVRVIDGDTVDLAGTRIRLWGVDAPERDQVCEDAAGAGYRCGDRSTRELDALTAGELVSCEARDTDQYGRTVARCTKGGADVGGQMVRAGQAVDYTRYSRGAYLADELRARRERVGLWQGRFVRPEEWRHAR